ncbi:uncharacterized protein LOC118438845 [Folsomia candida]|uniref:Uncharacterized protein n=1 Tax=Folsomia candida TaxID=158441 RepID=A0A226DC06_FOLCA|nr:uncharacterized protein LOC118438845 [Folsomia candida]OXA42171.1 hypothetical protein Fcan01_23270 [Folsomia candida]
MPTPLAFKALTYNFKINDRLCKLPISHNPKSNQFVITKLTSASKAQYSAWFFNVFFLFLTCTMGSSGYVVIRQFIKPKQHITMVHTILYTMISGAGSIVAGIVVYVVKYGEEAVDRVNWLVWFHEEQLKGTVVTSAKMKVKKAKKPPIWRNLSGDLDTFGLAMSAVFFPLPYIPLIAVPFGMIANLDVYKFVLEDFIPTAVYELIIVQIVIRSISAVIAYICFAESVRIFPMIGYLAVLPIQLLTRIVGKMGKIDLTCRPISHILSVLYSYTQISSLVLAMQENDATSNFLLLQTGIWLGAGSIYGTIRLHNVVPLGFYLIFPFFILIVLIITEQLLPVIVSILENSKTSLAQWVTQLSGNGRPEDKCLRRYFTAMRPIRYVAGLNGNYFYDIDNSIMTSFLCSILDNAINLLMSLPVVHVA